MRRAFRAISIACSAFLLLGLAWALSINAGETTKTVRIIYTNDTMGYLEGCG